MNRNNATTTHPIDGLFELIIEKELADMGQPTRLECAIREFLPFREDFGMNMEGASRIVTGEDGWAR